ncbi:MAG: TRAP transporter small permease subunit [Granulosicoccus sp.]|nr:TRAP transporter small permease subunit [Granulosicoccus sp.]
MVEHEITGPIDRFNWLLSRVTMWLVAAIVAVMFYEVVMRYVFAKPTLWVNEMSLWLGGMIYLFAGLYAMQQRSHIRIFILYDICPRWLRILFDGLSTLFIICFAAAVVFGGYGEAIAKLMRWERFGTAFDPPIPATMKPLVLITVIIMAIQAVSNFFYDLGKEPVKHTPEPD